MSTHTPTHDAREWLNVALTTHTHAAHLAPRMAPLVPRSSAAHHVLSDPDLLMCILSGSVRAYVAIRQLCRATRDTCMDHKALLRTVALNAGGLKKCEFVGLFSLTYQEGSRYPHSRNGRRHIFSAPAIDQALARPDCMDMIRIHAICSRVEREVYLRRRYGGERAGSSCASLIS